MSELEAEATWAAVPLPPRSPSPADGSPTLQRQVPSNLPPRDASGSQQRPKVESARRPRSAQRTYGFLAVFFLCGGLIGTMVGFFGGLLVARTREAPASDQAVPVVQYPPRLQVFAPEGSKLTVDGVEVLLSAEPPTVLTLTAGRPTRIEVALEGHLPYGDSFNLQANDLQVLHLDLATLEVRER